MHWLNLRKITRQAVYVATVEQINSTMPGSDLPQKMRNFLLERYPTSAWGIEDVLLIGSYTDVPMRTVYQDFWYGKPKTDFYYAELSAADNVNWDSNNNGRYWDDNDNADYWHRNKCWNNTLVYDHYCGTNLSEMR